MFFTWLIFKMCLFVSTVACGSELVTCSCLVLAKNNHSVLPHMQPGATGDVEVKSRTCDFSLLFSDFILNCETCHSRR